MPAVGAVRCVLPRDAAPFSPRMPVVLLAGVAESVRDGADALERALHAPPQAVLLDPTVPVMGGFALLERPRATHGRSDIPVAVPSARDPSAAGATMREGEVGPRGGAVRVRRLDAPTHGASARGIPARETR